ncbi:HNH endonuclease family protein [Marinobacter adhaerens]|uniref:HNH endonuclease family protein n=1 Tax=Marinobacter adhaerens TaxID=1033846 RepID=UPI001E5A30E0|nr:HNH endonuclease family protein [Marinobacter adhaerens]
MSSTPVRFATDRRCRVVTGRWISPFSGNVIQNASEADIGHVVPLKWAWDRGANHWSDANRERFANDPVNLLPVEALIAAKVQEARWNGCHPLGNVRTWRGFPE